MLPTLRILGACAVWTTLLACSHGPSISAEERADLRAIRIASYAGLLQDKGRAEGSPYVNCLGFARVPTQFPPVDAEFVDEEPPVLAAFDSRPEFVAPLSVCRRPTPSSRPVTIAGKTAREGVRIEIDLVERSGPDTATVWLALIPQCLDEPCVPFSTGLRLRLLRVSGEWRVVETENIFTS